MNGLKAVKVAELRSRLAAIPAKIILALVVTTALSWDTDFGTTFDTMIADPLKSAKLLVIFYGVISYVYFFIRLFHSYIVGILVAAVAAYAVFSIRDRFTADQFMLIELFMIFGGPVMDVLRFIRYLNMKREVLAESRDLKDKIDDIYDNVHGYEEGFDRGYESGYFRGRSENISFRERERLEEYDDEEGYDDGYDDEYDDGYIEERNEPKGLPGGFFQGIPPRQRQRLRGHFQSGM